MWIHRQMCAYIEQHFTVLVRRQEVHMVSFHSTWKFTKPLSHYVTSTSRNSLQFNFIAQAFKHNLTCYTPNYTSFLMVSSVQPKQAHIYPSVSSLQLKKDRLEHNIAN